MTHRYFFARKFLTSDLGDESRVVANRFSRGEYYSNLAQYIPQQVLHQLMQNGLRYLQLENDTELFRHDWTFR